MPESTVKNPKELLFSRFYLLVGFLWFLGTAKLLVFQVSFRVRFRVILRFLAFFCIICFRFFVLFF